MTYFDPDKHKKPLAPCTRCGKVTDDWLTTGIEQRDCAACNARWEEFDRRERARMLEQREYVWLSR